MIASITASVRSTVASSATSMDPNVNRQRMLCHQRMHMILSSMIMLRLSARVGASPNPFQRRRFASQTKPLQECHPERSEGSLSGERSFAALRMTKRDGLFFEMDWGQALPLHLGYGCPRLYFESISYTPDGCDVALFRIGF